MRLEQKEHIFSLADRPTPSCHASTLILLPNDDVLAAWFGGAYEGAQDVEIWCARRTRAGWTEPWQISPGCDVPCWNPVLYREGKKITLWYKQGTPIPAWYTMTRESTDEGETWTPARELVAGDRTDGRGPVKNKPLRLRNGWLLAGASHESLDGHWLAFSDLTQDGGETWIRSAYLDSLPRANLIQPTLWESESGVHMLLRSNAGYIYRADSRDHGITWSRAVPIPVPNNNSGIDCAALPDGRVALACNPVGEASLRTPLCLMLSEDDGLHFSRILDLAAGEGEYSYPAVIFAGGCLHVTFTDHRTRIAYCRIRV